MEDVVLVDGVRTPIGNFGGSLRDVHPADLGAIVVRELLRRTGLPPDQVDDVYFGCVGQVAESAYIARMVALKAGIPPSANAVSINRLCGSGLEAIVSAARAIRAGDIRIAVAGGVESMSQMPFYLRRARWGQMRLGHDTLEDGLITMLTDPFGFGHMGETAERVAERYGISREEQDAFALESHRRAVRAIDSGEFEGQIVPVPVPDARDPQQTTLFSIDERPRRDTTLSKLAALKPAFRAGGTVTAGNSSGISDGAAAVLVMGARTAEELDLQPRLRLVCSTMAGIEPEYMGYAPTLAIPRALKRAGLRVSDIDVVELNEAFAAQSVAVVRDAGLDPSRTNPNGGAIALGHPVGATGCILTVKAMHYLRRHRGRYALVTMCIGGGQALATIFENPSHDGAA